MISMKVELSGSRSEMIEDDNHKEVGHCWRSIMNQNDDDDD